MPGEAQSSDQEALFTNHGEAEAANPGHKFYAPPEFTAWQEKYSIEHPGLPMLPVRPEPELLPAPPSTSALMPGRSSSGLDG
jgi:hypothetical protein